ncbi:hemicentin-1 [Caerostris darwini]|uniref:Hemicentin-1 n=1 Tax=Caerostris darwini TaxID=1538125 RepID=A0AAV4UJT0_9ARAC|nr:hemicentin-1 [Caerostris darwini]
MTARTSAFQLTLKEKRSISKRRECLSELIYEGRKFVAQGYPFNISCLKSSYGVPKWTRNGLAVDTLGPEYVVKEKKLPNDGVRMELRVEAAVWKHRGYYKCDPLSGRSHEIEIVPSREGDEEMRERTRVQLKPNKNLKLVCDQEENAVFPINWYKDGTRILENRKNSRIRMQGRSLAISRATESDAGEYMCVIEMAGLSFPFADHLGSRVKVTYPARVEKFPPQFRPILNRYLNLECKVQGFPIPRISWFVDGFPSKNSDSTIPDMDLRTTPTAFPMLYSSSETSSTATTEKSAASQTTSMDQTRLQ